MESYPAHVKLKMNLYNAHQGLRQVTLIRKLAIVFSIMGNIAVPPDSHLRSLRPTMDPCRILMSNEK